MIFEFALDPRILTRWETYDRLVNDCGVEKGRLISDFPNQWKRMVKDEVLTNPGTSAMDAERILFHLQHRLAPKLIATNRTYDLADSDWLGQAVRAHDGEQPFRAIVAAENPTDHEKVIVAAQLDRENPLWRVKRSDSIPRKPQTLAALARPLFKISSEVRFIDPHFKPNQPRYQDSLAALLAALRSANLRIQRVEVHLSVERNDVTHAEISLAEFQQDCSEHLPEFIPAGVEVGLFRWRRRRDGEGLHARFILTDRGGIAVEHGLDAGRDGETTPVFLLDEEDHQKHWADFDHIRPAGADVNWRSVFQLEARCPVIIGANA